MKIESNRTGKVIQTLEGYGAFIPNDLPPTNPPLQMSDSLQKKLSDADRKLGRLDGITEVLPNPDLFVAMYVKKEALLSAQIEGTQASLMDVLNVSEEGISDDVTEVVNYVNAMNRGLQMLDALPMSLRLIKEIHKILLKGVRGSSKNPGEFRHSQNWIGTFGATLNDAIFVPPPKEEMMEAMGKLEKFFYDETPIPILIKIALIHAQFETIHPFLDGNGRMGRLLITFWLCQQKILGKPLLYLSYYFKKNRDIYYDKLMRVRTHGEWEAWISFFLDGVASVADEATRTAKAILELKENCTKNLEDFNKRQGLSAALLDLLFLKPVITKKEIAQALNISLPTSINLINKFCSLGILIDFSPKRLRDKSYIFKQYYRIMEEGTKN